jgi:hypothetical protein
MSAVSQAAESEGRGPGKKFDKTNVDTDCEEM